jgi:hypothetical protein
VGLLDDGGLLAHAKPAELDVDLRPDTDTGSRTGSERSATSMLLGRR